MFKKFLCSGILCLFLGLQLPAQDISSLSYSSHLVLPHGFVSDGHIVGGLSGIAYNSRDSLFYLVADKSPARIFKIEIKNNDLVAIELKECLVLQPGLLTNSELEGIAYHYRTGNFYVSDEQKKGTRILELTYEANFIRIIEPVNQSFLSLSGYNSGIEGLTISNDLNYLYYAFERPTKECLALSLVRITKIDLSGDSKQKSYFYNLHDVASDKINTNGIADILFVNDSKLLVMERAYIPNQGNVVRLYQVNLTDSSRGSNCGDQTVVPVESTLLFDFSTVRGFNIDNAEGMTFNADRSMLYIITDNNFSKKQETQLIALKVSWN